MRSRKRKNAPDSQTSITLDRYQDLAKRTDQNRQSGLEGLAFPLLGLFGEVGTLLSALKKKQRDQEAFIGYAEAVKEEFGDVLWYYSNIASRASLGISLLAAKASRGLGDWDEVEQDSRMTFMDIQASRRAGGSPNSQAFETAIIALAGKVGLLLNDFHLDKIANNRDVLSAHLVEILRALVEAANEADIDLEGAADANIQKIESRWPSQKEFTPLFDSQFGPLEQLPRNFEMEILELKRGKKTYVIQRCKGLNIGSELTDNRMAADDYRFHDVFHLAYAAVLGWSPVLRALFKVKRKSKPAIDEGQDGARAILIEEGISTLVFHRAKHLDYFDSVPSLDYSLLKLIPDFVHGYEVESCPLWQWEKAILDGFAVFRSLREHRGGVVVVDMEKRSIIFRRRQQ